VTERPNSGLKGSSRSLNTDCTFGRGNLERNCDYNSNEDADVIGGSNGDCDVTVQHRSQAWHTTQCQVCAGHRNVRNHVYEICVPLGCYAASCGNCLPTFRGNVSVPSSGIKKSDNYHSTPRNTREVGRSDQHRGGCLKPQSRMFYVLLSVYACVDFPLSHSVCRE
jgi:hypothetical protein